MKESSITHRGTPSLLETACERCGTVDIPQLAPGNGPHAFRANCRHCGAFIRWVSRYTPAERAYRREARQQQVMSTFPPTGSQLAYLLALGWEGAMPADRAAASALIAELREGRGIA